jgi:alkylhydroperoxidase/carboxymuconolactone decarboxylase family protein YurZ
MAQLDDRQQEIKDTFMRNRGYWADVWEEVLKLSPDFFEAYMELSSVPWKVGVLEPKIKEFIYIAIDAATTHLYRPGLRVHVRNALQHGATMAEIMEVLQLTSVLGIHTCTMGVPVLIEELREAGQGAEVDDAPLSHRQGALKETFIKNRGYWNEFWDGLLKLSPDFFEAYLKFSSVPWTTGTLEPKVREFVYIAIDAATTHLYEPGLRQHIRNALRYGATKEELMEVLQLTSVLGMHTVSEGVPVLVEEAKASGKGGLGKRRG